MPNCQEWENDWGTPTLPEDSNSLLTPEELNPGRYRSEHDRNRDRDRRDRETYRDAYRRRW